MSRNLRVLRSEAKMTQQELANEAGFKVSHISRLESTPQNVTLVALERLARALKCAPARLLSDDTISLPGRAIDTFEDAFHALETFRKRLHRID